MANGISTEPERKGRAAGLRKAGDVTRWMVTAAVALTGALAALASQAVPGRSSVKSRPHVERRAARATSTPPESDTAPGESASPPLQPPAEPPQSADPSAGAVQSGGS